MATTKLNDIINPQVMGDMIEAKIPALCKFMPYAKLDTTLEGVPGDTKTVPSWNYIGDADDFDVEAAADTDSEAPTSKLTAGFTTFTIGCILKAVSILQTAINSGLGDPIGQAETQLAKSIVGALDTKVVGAAYSATGNMTAPSTLAVIGYAGIVDANAKFEDEEDGIEKVMFIHPKQEATILKDDDFRSADKFEAGVAVRGSIGKISGCWVKKSKKVRPITQIKDNASGTITITKENLKENQKKTAEVLAVGDKVKALAAGSQFYLNPIIKLEPDSAETEYTEAELPAITIFLKKNTQVDHEWFPKKQRHDITASKYAGVALTNASKVVLAKFKP